MRGFFALLSRSSHQPRQGKTRVVNKRRNHISIRPLSATGGRKHLTSAVPAHAQAWARPNSTGLPVALGLALTLVVSSCQSYEAKPLDFEAYRQSWHTRQIDRDSLLQSLEEPLAAQLPAEFDPSDGLQLAEGRVLARFFHPDMRIARLQVQRALVGADNAGAWNDPVLNIGALNIDSSASDPWFLSLGLQFELPLSGRLDAERAEAEAMRVAAVRELQEVEWHVWHELQRAWLAWSSAGVRLEESQASLADLQGLADWASSLAEQGELPRTEAALFRIEVGRRRMATSELQQEQHELEQAALAAMGLASEAELRLVPTFAIPGSSVNEGSAQLEGRKAFDAIATSNPSLVHLKQEYELAEKALQLEILAQLPSLALGPAYEQESGESRIGLLAGLPLPMWNANRHGIAEARVDRELARVRLEVAYEKLSGQWVRLTRKIESLAARREALEVEWMPIVTSQLEDARQLLRIGEGSSMVLLESLTRAQDTAVALIELRSASALAIADLAHLIGPQQNIAPASADAPMSEPKTEPLTKEVQP
ncbi:MAG: outer membrane protein TolC [Planctomycetota bacterium]